MATFRVFRQKGLGTRTVVIGVVGVAVVYIDFTYNFQCFRLLPPCYLGWSGCFRCRKLPLCDLLCRFRLREWFQSQALHVIWIEDDLAFIPRLRDKEHGRFFNLGCRDHRIARLRKAPAARKKLGDLSIRSPGHSSHVSLATSAKHRDWLTQAIKEGAIIGIHEHDGRQLSGAPPERVQHDLSQRQHAVANVPCVQHDGPENFWWLVNGRPPQRNCSLMRFEQ
jgi:hypothetical protein